MRPDDVDLAALFAEHRRHLVRMALPFVDDIHSAEDVVQDAFTGLCRRERGLRDPQAALAYLRRSVVNGSHSTLRRRRTVRAHLRVAEPDSLDGPDAPLLLADEHAEVLAAVRRLSGRSQQVLALRYWSELSDDDIADTLGITAGSVRSAISRALDRLQAELEKTP